MLRKASRSGVPGIENSLLCILDCARRAFYRRAIIDKCRTPPWEKSCQTDYWPNIVFCVVVKEANLSQPLQFHDDKVPIMLAIDVASSLQLTGVRPGKVLLVRSRPNIGIAKCKVSNRLATTSFSSRMALNPRDCGNWDELSSKKHWQSWYDFWCRWKHIVIYVCLNLTSPWKLKCLIIFDFWEIFKMEDDGDSGYLNMNTMTWRPRQSYRGWIGITRIGKGSILLGIVADDNDSRDHWKR